MDRTYPPWQIVTNPHRVYSANTELPDDGLNPLPALQRSNQKFYQPESSINHLTQYAGERLQLIERCDRLLAATDQRFAGPFISSDFEQNAGKFWQQHHFSSEEIQYLYGLTEPRAGQMSDDSAFHDGAWTRPTYSLEYQIEETCQGLRDMKFTKSGMSANLLTAPGRGTTALTSYVENEETFWNPFRTQPMEQHYSHRRVYGHKEIKQPHAPRIADRWSLHADGNEEGRADNIWSASQGPLSHPQQSPEEPLCDTSSNTSGRSGEAERQQSAKYRSDRERPQRQQCDGQRSEKGQYDRHQRHEHPQSEQRRDVKQPPSECQRCDMKPSERQRAHRSRSDKQPEFKSPRGKSEASDLDDWKMLLLSLEELNTLMIFEEVKTVEQMNEGRRASHNRGTDDIFTPGHAERTKQTLKLRPTSEGPRSGKSRTASAPFQCIVTGPYWEWNSVSPTVLSRNVTVTESIQDASDQAILRRWMSEHSRNTLLEYVGRLRELHRRLSNKPDKARLISKPLLEWMLQNKIGDTSRSRAQSNELIIVLAGRERARAQMMSA
ncbi:MAG: hypothetical protein Q9195_003638 [Heterodermia aff. obscurata]